MLTAIGIQILLCVVYGFANTRSFINRSGAYVLWLVFSAACGLSLQTVANAGIDAAALNAFAVSFGLLASMALFYIQSNLLKGFAGKTGEHEDDFPDAIYGGAVEFFDIAESWRKVRNLILVSAIHFIGSAVVIIAAWFAKEQIVNAAVDAYNFGPEGLKKLNGVVAGVATLLASVGALGLWATSRKSKSSQK